MKLDERICSDLIDAIDEVLYEQLRGWGHYEFDCWDNAPAGFAIILRGDWSHMHARADNLVSEEARKHGYFVKVYETEIGHSDCDYYESYHRYMFRKSEPKKTKAEIAEENYVKALATSILNS